MAEESSLSALRAEIGLPRSANSWAGPALHQAGGAQQGFACKPVLGSQTDGHSLLKGSQFSSKCTFWSSREYKESIHKSL